MKTKKINATLHEEMLGSIGCLVRGTKQDLAFTKSKLSQYERYPREIHLQAVKRVLWYIQSSKNYKQIKGQLSLLSDVT